MSTISLNTLIEAGDLSGLRAALVKADKKALNTPDLVGRTPLACAVQSTRADAEIVRALIAHGARLVQTGDDDKPDVVRVALSAGDPEKVVALGEAGADLRYRTAKGYDALIDAVHGRDVTRDGRLMAMLEVLIGAGVAIDGRTAYGETAVRVLSRFGRFDALAVLFEAGADRTQLRWNALHEAVAFGALADVAGAAAEGLEAQDDWGRTPFLLAVVVGDVPKVRCLHERGADVFALGRGGETALHLAATHHCTEVMAYLLGEGMDVDGADYYGRTPLMAAAEADDAVAAALLIARGADIARDYNGGTALTLACVAEVARVLLDAGADPQRLSNAGRRALLGFAGETDLGALASVSDAAFARACTRRFGSANPEAMTEPFLAAMTRSGANAYSARKSFAGGAGAEGPVWCAQRFGQSLTFLPDGRIVEIGGEHEDYYDPDFCIYNDVFVHDRAGGLQIFGYPKSVFPPTDFHTATLVGDDIYVIGSLGYKGTRDFGTTPVFRLDTRTWRFEAVGVSGEGPGWIYRHAARLMAAEKIEITGGEVLTGPADKEFNGATYELDIARATWRVVG